MSTRYDLKTWRKSANGKAYTVRLGSAWTDDKGTIRLAFDALPLPDENGRVQAFLEVTRERDMGPSERSYRQEDEQDRRQAQSISQGGYAGLDDDIPFMMEWR